MEDLAHADPDFRSKVRTKIFLGFTSNFVSCGVREQLRYMIKNKCVDVVVTTAGGIEEDLIKCMHATYVGSFELKGRELRKQGLNRIGNMLVPNVNYCGFEDWLSPILDAMLKEQKENGINWTPSKVSCAFGYGIS